MLTRQKILLKLIACGEDRMTRLRLVKLAFLLSKESDGINSFYDFLPYRFGPFSFTLYFELDKLLRKRHLNETKEPRLGLTSSGNKLSDSVSTSSIFSRFSTFWQRYGELPTNELLDIVYVRFPWYTLNREMVEKRAVSRPKSECVICMAGYEGMSVDGFLNRLLQAGIYRLIDVRSNPVARRYGFHKSTLQRLCEHLGIAYTHHPALGVPSAWRSGLKTKSDYETLFQRYKAEVLAEQRAEVEHVADLMTRTPSMLMCRETNPKYCHRVCLANALAEISGLPVKDLRGTSGRV